MTQSNEQKVTALIFIFGTIISSFSFYWSYQDVLNQTKQSVLLDLPYVRMSTTFTLISLLFGIINLYDRKIKILENGSPYDMSETIIAYWFSVPLIFLLIYPGTEALKIHSDSKVFSCLFSIATIQCIVLYLFSNKDNYHNIKISKYVQLLMIAVGVIFIADLAVGLLGFEGSRLLTD